MTGSLRPSELVNREFHRILLVKPSSLGDVIHALPVLHALRQRYPHARIDWLIGTAFAPLLENNPDLSETILFDRHKFARVGWSFAVTRDFARFVADLRARQYDLVIDLQGLFRSGFLSRVTAAPVRIGFAQARERAGMFYTHKIPPAPIDTHAVDRNMRVGRLLGFSSEAVEFPLGIDESLRTQVTELLGRYGIAVSQPYFAVAPAARWETKRWPPRSFVQTIGAILQQPDVHCVLVGGADDASLCEEIREQCGPRSVSLAGKTSIREMIVVLERAAAVLCLDSAPMHIAAALGRPLICLTGPTNPARTGPYGRSDDVLRLPLECSPCYFRKLSQCPHDHRCMRELDAHEVIARTRALLANAPSHAGV